MIIFITLLVLRYWEEEIDSDLKLAAKVTITAELIVECLLLLILLGDINGTL